MYTNSTRHRMHEHAHQNKVNKLKEGDDILYSCGNMVGSGTVFQIKETEIIVQTGNGGRGLEYINKSQVIFK